MTPGVLTDALVAAIVGAVHNAHQAGPWALVELVSDGDGQRITFASGYRKPDGVGDERPYVVVRVEELR